MFAYINKIDTLDQELIDSLIKECNEKQIPFRKAISLHQEGDLDKIETELSEFIHTQYEIHSEQLALLNERQKTDC